MRKTFLTSIFKELISNCNLRSKTTLQIYHVLVSSSSRICINLKPKELIKKVILRVMIRGSPEACLHLKNSSMKTALQIDKVVLTVL